MVGKEAKQEGQRRRGVVVVVVVVVSAFVRLCLCVYVLL
jgi:hypothetical protein